MRAQRAEKKGFTYNSHNKIDFTILQVIYYLFYILQSL